ncbi:MAG: hypothetical protein FWG34_13840 [Oscillospiraceae bacterium]|nr:hypothetical protein [Oscillospiraceae bacterium]
MNAKLSDAARHILNDPQLISIRENWFARLRSLFAGTDDAKTVFAINGINGNSKTPGLLYSEPERWMIESLENLAENAERAKNADIFAPLCIQNGIFGVHFVDSIFGCNVYYEYGQWYSGYLKCEVGKLSFPDIGESEAWQLTRRVTDAFLAADVQLPVYGLPTIASVLNIAVNLYGERILTAMLCDPGAAAHDLKIINDVLVDLHRRMIALLPAGQLQPVIPDGRIQMPESGQICGCTTQLISPECYRDMIAPLDGELLGVYPNGGMVHLCGAHEHHIPAFRDMKTLRAVQLNDRASEGLAKYHAGLRHDQIIYLNPCDAMPAKKAVDITGGKRLVLVGEREIFKKP